MYGCGLSVNVVKKDLGKNSLISTYTSVEWEREFGGVFRLLSVVDELIKGGGSVLCRIFFGGRYYIL